MSERIRSAVYRRAMLACIGVAALACALPAAATAAAPTPASFTNCGGSVSRDNNAKAVGEPNLLDYKFRCDGNISAYTVIVNQQGDAGSSIDDYNPAPSVFEDDGVTPSPKSTVTCEGVTPSNGINCNLGAGASLTAFNSVVGSVDPLQAYCKHLPAKGKAGAAAVPQAWVELVVTDSTGAQDGPFVLRSAKPCPKVPNVVPATKASKKHARARKSKHSRAAR